jgi:alpha-tubulin suppressor-like RCC1 family protein
MAAGSFAGVRDLSCGCLHTCALTVEGEALCWGSNAAGQLGISFLEAAKSSTPISSSLGAAFVALSSGGSHTCALSSEGRVLCWGDNSEGQLGDGNIADSSAPVLALGIHDTVALSAGFAHTCAVLNTGKVFCWGSGKFGQLGNSSFASSRVPVEVLD